MKTKILLFSALSISASLFSQNVAINSTGAAPVNSAALDVDMSDKGLLIPRIALTSTTVFTPITGTSTISLLVYNTATAGVSPDNVTPGFYFWNGSKWEKIVSKTEENTVGDVKQGFQISDHNGWVLLDGRMISTLTSSQQTAASSLGFSSTIPNASGKVLKMQGALGTTGGSSTVSISQSNLPNFNMSATTSSSGAHSHTGTTSTNGAHSHNMSFHNDDWNGGGGGNRSLEDDAGSWYSVSTDVQGSHNHTFTTTTDGTHTHTLTVNSGGSGVSLNVENSYLSTNTFIYLGN